VFLQRLLRPEGGALEAHLKEHPHRWLARLRVLWYPMAIGLPLLLVGLAAAGYYYTALQLENQLVASVWLIAGAVIAYDLAIRWLTVENRKHALIKAQEQRTAARAAEAAKAGAGATGEGVLEQLDIPEIDIPTINRQTRHLLRTLIVLSAIVGLWLIWAEVLPALRILDTITVWQYAVVTDGQERWEPITLADLALGVVLAIIAWVAVRNVPGVLEVALLRRLSIEPGSRYAITQIARYVIAVVGVIVVFNTIGGQWSQVQWLVAALSVGLGFGLQEIFGNFVSGLILLFERPVRLGDVVTVKDITGTVSRIRIRATTITDADKRELIVPNKTLITGEVINWTLSDTTTRVVIPVSIAYRADLALAHRVISDAVRAHPLIMPDPGPAVVIVGFAEGAINIEVRVFVKELAQRELVDHELRLAIHDKLRAHHIETPLPERTVNVRSFVPILSQGPEKPQEAQRAGSGVNPADVSGDD
ncbi:MAG: mechanosensitive ion channel domain-containing protein, partial [Gammaproteobacteria bacterium]